MSTNQPKFTVEQLVRTKRTTIPKNPRLTHLLGLPLKKGCRQLTEPQLQAIAVRQRRRLKSKLEKVKA